MPKSEPRIARTLEQRITAKYAKYAKTKEKVFRVFRVFRGLWIEAILVRFRKDEAN